MDRSILDPEAFLRTGVIGVHVLLEACRTAPRTAALPAGLDRRGLRLGGDRGVGRGRSARAALALRGREGGRRAAGPQLCRDPRPRRGGDPRGEHLWPVPPPGEADPAVRDQRHRRPAAAALRRRTAATRLALRRGPCGGDRHRVAPRGERRDLQRARRVRDGEPRDRPPPARAPRQAVVAGPPRRGPPRPRPPVCHGRLADRGARLAAADGLRRRASPRPIDWYLANEAWWRAARSDDWDAYYERQYGARLRSAG